MHRAGLSLLACALVAVAGFLPGAAAEAQTWRTMTSARQVWDRQPLDVQIQYSAGRLTIAPADPPLLYQMEIRYPEESFSPVAEYDRDRGSLRLGVRSLEASRRSINVRDGSTATIGLTREVPLDLSLNFGAGQADIELGGVALRRLAVSTGASETTLGFDAPNPVEAQSVSIEAGAADLRVTGLGNSRAARVSFKGGVGATVLDFGGAWDRSAAASVQMGLGSLTLRVPRRLGLRIDRSSFLTSFTAPGMEREGNSYYSANWRSAPHRLTIDISAALGSITVQWID